MTKMNSRYVYYRPHNDDAAQQALASSALVVEGVAGQYPRAYQENSALVSVKMPGQSRRETLIRVPVAYKGLHVVPQNATQLNEFVGAMVDSALAQGGRRGALLSGGERVGVALPADFDPATDRLVAPSQSSSGVSNDARLYRLPLSKLEEVQDILKDPAAHTGEDTCNSLLGADGKTLPELVVMRNGAYLVYDGVADDVDLPIDANPDLGAYAEAAEMEAQMKEMFGQDYDGGRMFDDVELVERVSHAELAWISADAQDIKNGIKPPEPPAALAGLYCTDHFRARGASYDALEEISARQVARNEAEKALEVALFGPPSVKQTFNVQGRTWATYDTKLHPVYEGGHAIGIRCDWTPLHPNYTNMKNVAPPAGWDELKSHPGVFAPNPASNPEDVEKLAALDWPDYRDYPAAFGGPEPVIRIEHDDKATYPRAYRTFSRVHALQDANGPLYYIDAPTDYKGKAFQPEGAERLTKFEYGMLLSGMGDMYEPAFVVRDEGVPTPGDYKFAPPENAEQKIRYFKLAGRSLQIFEDFEKENEAIADERRKFIESVGGAGSYSYQGAEILSVEFEGDVPPNWLVEREHKATNIDDDGNLVDVSRFTCVPDTSTPEGQELARRMKEDFEGEADFRDLQARWTPGAPYMPHPQWRYEDGNERVFYYVVDEVKGGPVVPPPDAVELKPHVTQWLSRDKTDRMSGVKPPPMPPGIKSALSRQSTKPGHKGPAPGK